MEILGRGLIATAFGRYEDRVDDAVVFACGVPDSAETHESAYRRELDMLDATIQRARQQDRRLVYLSGGGAIYGDCPGIRDEGTPLRPETRYGRHQAEAEARIRALGVKHLIARLGNLVGPNQNPSQLVPNLTRQALAGRARIFRDATRDVMAADDAVRLAVEVLETGVDDMTVVIARGSSVPVPELFAEIERVLGVRAQIELVPAGDAQMFSVSRLERHLGRSIRPQVSDLKTVLRRFLPVAAGRGMRE